MTTSAEQIVLSAVRARRRFKALVRLAYANKHWLEDVEDEQLTENVKKNIILLTKKKSKRGLITLQQKALLNKPAQYRTDEEKILLNKIISGLKCFRKYPEQVKMQLAGVTYFAYFGPQRVIVRQNHIAHALYFIISGEVAVSITTYDPVLKENVTTVVGTMVPGSMFGEVSLLHDIPRTATITTTTACEFLYLKKADFNIVLKESVKEQWDEIQRAMLRFRYFDKWDAVSVRECCIYSKIKPYVRDQTILGDGVGISSSIYFVLKGQCKLIEHLLLSVSYDRCGRKQYKLYDSAPTLEEGSEEESIATVLDEAKQSLTSLRTYKSPRSRLPTVGQTGSMLLEHKIKKRRPVSVDYSEHGSKLEDITQKLSLLTAPQEAAGDADDAAAVEVKESQASNTELPSNVETHFMQVCTFSELACFGLGENMRRRRVVAMSDYVECLLIPRYWLFTHNKSNLWSKIHQYLDTQIPSTEAVFASFLQQRKWMAYRSQLVKDMLRRPPCTDRYNIPYSIRINEEIHLT